jgi:hypothetical protein
MNSLSSHLFRATALALALPVLGMCAAVQINGVCVDGNCFSPVPVSPGTPYQSGASSSQVTLNTDPFQVNTAFDVSYNSAGSLLHFYPSATYTGSAPSVGASDTITIDLLASVFDSGPGSFDGTYTEHIPLLVTAGSVASGQLFVDTQSLPKISCTGAAFCDPAPVSAYLSGLNGDTLNYDFQFIFTFTAGTAPGGIDSSPAVPEPAQMIPAALSLVGFGLVALRRRKK